jgi:hypothetical protein
MARMVSFEGRTVSVPDDATDDEIAGILEPASTGTQAEPARPKMDAAGDVGGGIVSGLIKGVTSFAGMPGMMQQAEGYLGGKALDALGFPNAANTVRGLPFLPTPETLDKGVEKVTGPLYKPETVSGQFAQTIGEFAPGALIGPGGVVRKVAETVVPAVASESAGQVTKGTVAEPYARLMGALFGNLGTAAVAARADAPTRVIRTAADRVQPAQFDEAQRIAETGQRIGVPLTGAEALQQATGNGTKLADVQRFVEGSPQSAQLSEMMAARPGQMRAATGETLDTIAPQSPTPSTLGPRAAETAEGAIDDVRQGINAATRPNYDAAGRHVLDPADFDPIARDPAFQASLRRLRADEVLGPTYQGQPDNSVAVIDAVTKDMRDRGVALGNAANPGFSSQTAGIYGQGATEARAIARDPARGGVQEYDDALTAQAQARAQNLAPLEQGPLGRVAAADSTDAAGRAILPGAGSPHLNAGGEEEIADTVRRLVTRDPELTAQLVRQRLGNQADTSMTRLVGGEAQGGGARFAKDIAGTDQQGANLGAVLRELPNSPDAPASVDALLDVLRATGTRKPQGSPTDFNAQYRAEIGGETVAQQGLAALRTQGRSLFANAGDATRRAYLGRNNAQLAEILAAPDSVQQIRALIAQGAETPFADAFARMTVQGAASR